MSFNPTVPFNDLPDLPPATEVETKAVLKACINARDALGRLNTAIQRLPNPDVLIRPFSLQEARDSSAIENIVTTDDALFAQSQLPFETADPAVKEAMRYQQALYDGFRKLSQRPIGTRMAIDICRAIKGYEIDVRKVPGTTIKNVANGEVIYTPPAGEDVIRDKLANWEKFLHGDSELDPIVKLAIQHYQFEAIHPFGDGNGRTGRVLNILYLIENGLLDLPVLYLSRQILATRSVYYELLLRVSSAQEWTPWILYFSTSVAMSAYKTTVKAWQIQALMQHTDETIHSKAPKIASAELLTVLFANPYCRIADLIQIGIAKRQAASQYLKSLVEIGILEVTKVGREKIFLHPKFHAVLTGSDESIKTITKYPLSSTDVPVPLFSEHPDKSKQ